MSEELAKSDYEGAVKDSFEVADTDVALTLESVTDQQAHADDFECFAVEFRGPKEEPLEQGTFELTHQKLGSVEVFMTPVEEDDDGRVYQAVFNRKKNAG